MMRNVVHALAQSEFGVPRGSFLLLVAFVVAATVLLGINQGLTWSMTQTAKLDLTRADQRGLVIGLNEFSGYVGVAAAGVITGYAASLLHARNLHREVRRRTGLGAGAGAPARIRAEETHPRLNPAH
jgi:sugar phosphate permease